MNISCGGCCPLPPDIVYDEWLDPVGMTEWMCPRPARAVKISLEPSVGGSLRIDIEDSGSSLYVTGCRDGCSPCAGTATWRMWPGAGHVTWRRTHPIRPQLRQLVYQALVD